MNEWMNEWMNKWMNEIRKGVCENNGNYEKKQNKGNAEINKDGDKWEWMSK